MSFIALVVGATVWATSSQPGTMAAWADGSLPPPYNWLHPPPALAATNIPPKAGDVGLRESKRRSVPAFGFTGDGQAGIVDKAGVFRTSPRAKTVHVLIQPVDAPGHLPGRLTGDGNAYRMQAIERPGGRTPRLTGRLVVIFRFPSTPAGIYVYRRRSWHRLCDSSHAIITPTVISCTTSTLGTFLVTAMKT